MPWLLGAAFVIGTVLHGSLIVALLGVFTGVLFGLAGWCVYRFLLYPRLTAEASLLCIRNAWRTHTVPYTDIAKIAPEIMGITVRRRDGSRVIARAVTNDAFSLALGRRTRADKVVGVLATIVSERTGIDQPSILPDAADEQALRAAARQRLVASAVLLVAICVSLVLRLLLG